MFKLGVGKYVHAVMAREIMLPESDDKHRAFMITVYEDETKEPSMEFSAFRDKSFVNITSLGSFPPKLFAALPCYSLLKDII